MSTPAQKLFSLEGKTILVTGASSGLGQQIAISCSHRGARVVLTGRDMSKLEQTRERMRADDHLLVPADLTSAADRDALAQASPAIDGLVHCAGQQMLCPIHQLSEGLMTEMYNVNFLAPVMLTQRLFAAKRIAQQASIIFLLSTSAHIGTRGVGPYSAMKSGMLGIIRCLAIEQGKRKIRVNGISPSAVPTPMWGNPDDNAMLDAQRARHPLGLGTPEDVANGAIYLLSDASRWVTGTTLVMDGGAVI
jgi:NAD(P)-dependent dehydrogenase (short-subunit alcohol dehydrogenase family)